MKPISYSAKILAGMLLAVLPAKLDASDVQAIEGTWEVVSCTQKGEIIPAETGRRRLIAKGQMTRLPRRDVYDDCAITLDSTKSPKWIDLQGNGDGKAWQFHWLGIYSLTGETLTICIAEPEADRPTDFITRPAGETRILVLKRAQPEEVRYLTTPGAK